MLNDKKIQALYRQSKRGELSTNHKETDGGGLYLRGEHYWRFDYRYEQKRKMLALRGYLFAMEDALMVIAIEKKTIVSFPAIRMDSRTFENKALDYGHEAFL